MPLLPTLALFSLAALALLAVPGPAVLYAVSQSLTYGRRAGLVSMLGIETRGLFHVAAAATGLSALLASSASAFTELSPTIVVELVRSAANESARVYR